MASIIYMQLLIVKIMVTVGPQYTSKYKDSLVSTFIYH